ncbi:hypothetical protein D3C84_506280 [compost metagenome]
MRAVHPIGDPPTVRSELDPGADGIAVFRHLEFVVWHKLRCQDLQLQGHRKSVIQTARPQANKTLSRRFDRTCNQCLLTVKIGQAVRVRLIDPIAP